MAGANQSDQRTNREFQIRLPEDAGEIKRPVKQHDFNSRAVKLRLFALVCAVMFVLVLMFEARKPENWNWMGFEKPEPNIDTRYLANIYRQDSSSANQPITEGQNPQDQSKLELKSGSIQDDSRGDSPGSGDGQRSQPKSQAASDDASDAAFDRPEFQLAEKDFWDTNYRQLNFRQRMLLLEGFYRTRKGQQLDEHQASEWMRIVEQLVVANDRYQADILKYVNSLSEGDPERGELTQTLFQLQNRFDLFRPVIVKIGIRSELDETDQRVMKQIQQVLDRTMLGFVEDNSLQSFVNDQPAMFRLIEKIQQGQPWPTGLEPEKVMFSQLYKETDRLRGQPVTFKGLIRGGYTAKPAANYLGVESFYVYWVQIDGAQNPVAVYSLRQPDKFVANLDEHTASQPAEMREEVHVTGVLFQKMVYAAEDGQRIAPVIFTDVPAWKPKVETDSEKQELPGLTVMVGSFLAIGGTLAFFTWGFVSFNNRKHAKRITELKSRFESSDDGVETETANELE